MVAYVHSATAPNDPTPFFSFVSKPYPCLFSLPYSVTEDERRYRLHSVRSSVPRSRPTVLDDFLFAFLVLTRTSRFGSGSPRDERHAGGRNNRSSKQIQLYCTCSHMHHITPDESPASHAVWKCANARHASPPYTHQRWCVAENPLRGCTGETKQNKRLDVINWQLKEKPKPPKNEKKD